MFRLTLTSVRLWVVFGKIIAAPDTLHIVYSSRMSCRFCASRVPRKLPQRIEMCVLAPQNAF